MKLHLPVGLRTAVLSCFAVVSALSATLATATLTIGAFAASTSLASAETVEVTWDSRWGDKVLETAPSKVEEMNSISTSADTYLGTLSQYFIAGTDDSPAMTAVLVKDGNGLNKGVEFYGGNCDVDTSYDTWMKLTGGSVMILAGGNCCVEKPSHFTAAGSGSHILLAGGEAYYIVGGSFWGKFGSTFTGNSYITVSSGTVDGFIIGGSGARNETVNFIGDTHIWIDTYLGGVGTYDGTGSLPNNVIVGGNATCSGTGTTVTHVGNSSVTINLSKYTGEATDFNRLIIGDAWLKEGATSTHTAGGSTVSITGKEGMKFSQNIIGGSYLSKSSTATLSGDVSLTLNNASVSGDYVTGGSYGLGVDDSTMSNSTISGNITVKVKDSIIDKVLAGAGVSHERSYHTVGGDVTMTLSGSATAVKGGVYGGFYSNNEKQSTTSIGGTTTLNILGGSYATAVCGGSFVGTGGGLIRLKSGDIVVNVGSADGDDPSPTLDCTLYGGSTSSNAADVCTIDHGDITLNLISGSLNSVYAAGKQSSKATMTVESTTVSIGSGVTFAGGSIVSGGFEGTTNATVTGTRKLALDNLTADAYAALDNVTFKDFDELAIDTDSAFTHSRDILPDSITSFVKRGTGTLTYDASLSNITALTVEAGCLKIDQDPYENSFMQDSVSVAAGASIQCKGLMLHNGATIKLDISDSPTMAPIVAGYLIADGEGVLHLDLQGVDKVQWADDTSITLIKGSVVVDIEKVMWDNMPTNRPYLLSINTDGLSLSLDSTAWQWNFAGDDVWENKAGDNWKGKDADLLTDNQHLYFLELPSGQVSETVKIKGSLCPASVIVANAAGTEYIFQSNGAKSDAISDFNPTEESGKASLTKEGEGTLVIQLDNTYSGGTSLADGILRVEKSQALGTGEVHLNGGRLELMADISNAIVFSGNGTLVYGVNATDNVSQLKGNASVAVEVAAGCTATWNSDTKFWSTYTIDHGLTLSGGGTLKIVENEDPFYQGKTEEGGNYFLSNEYGFDEGGTTFQIGAGSTLYICANNDEHNAHLTLNGVLSGEGTLRVRQAEDLKKPFLFILAADNSDFAGTIEALSSDVQFATDSAAGGSETHLILGDTQVGAADTSRTLRVKDITLAGTVNFVGETTLAAPAVYLGTAKAAGAWSGNASFDTGIALTLVNGTVAEGQLVAAKTVKVDVAKDCTVDFGGNAGSLITEALTMAAGATLSNVGGDITDKVLNLTLDSTNIGDAETQATAMVQFGSGTHTLGSTTAAINLDIDADALAVLLSAHSTGGHESLLALTNGTLQTASGYTNVFFTGNASVLATSGLSISAVDGGTIVLSGTADNIYIAGPGMAPTEVTDGTVLSQYRAVVVQADQDMKVSLAGVATINNLVGASNTSLTVTNTATDGSRVGVTFNNSQIADAPTAATGPTTVFNGSIEGGEGVDFTMTGAAGAMLTVDGTFTADKLTAQAGTIKLNGGGDLDTLAIADAGKVELGAGTVKVGAIEDTAVAGAAGAGISIAEGGVLELDGATTTLDDANMKIYGPGTVKVGLGSTLTLEQAGQLDDVILELAGPGKQRALAVGTLDIGATTQDVAQLKGTGTVTAAGGTLTVTGQGGSYGGQLKGYGTLKVGAKAQQSFTGSFSPEEGWNLTNEGTMTLDLDRGLVGGQPLTLGALTLGSGSTTTISLNTDDGTAGIPLTLTSLEVKAGASLTLTSTGETVLETEGETIYLGRVCQEGDPTSYTVGDVADITLDTGCTAFMLVDAAATKLRVDELGRLVVNVVLDTSNQLTPKATTGNGKAGAELLWDAALHHVVHKDSLMEDLLGSIMQMPAGDAADEAMAAVAGAGTAVLGQALAGDVERQLRAIRNRTTTMGVNQAVVNEDMPYFNAWINAEGDYRKTESDGTAPGYELSSWGGTVGFDVDCSESLTLGLALTAMYGDLEADSVDRAKGDMDTYYVSAFARANSGRWVHSFVGTVGKMEGTLDRTVNYGNGTYRTQGETQGMGFGFMYEVGYTIPMDEDATCCLQPIANVTWRHAAIDAYDEEGSDCGLAVDEQSYDAVTLGLGARVQAVVGENLYNRTSIFEARALAKFDLGDREGESEVALLGCDEYKARVKGSELGAVGVEAGMGLTVPMGGGNSSLFFDASVEYRASYLNANGTVGYRVNF